MRIETHHPVKRERANRRNRHRANVGRAGRLRMPLTDETALDDMFSDRLDDRAEYERIISDFVSVHDAVLAADEYQS